MNKRFPSDRSNAQEITDLPPAISAMIDAAVARAAGSVTARRPVVPSVPPSVTDACTRMPASLLPVKRTRIPVPENMTLVGLFLVVFVACWMTALVGFNIARAADGTGVMCASQARPIWGQPVLPVKRCDRLPQQS